MNHKEKERFLVLMFLFSLRNVNEKQLAAPTPSGYQQNSMNFIHQGNVKSYHSKMNSIVQKKCPIKPHQILFDTCVYHFYYGLFCFYINF